MQKILEDIEKNLLDDGGIVNRNVTEEDVVLLYELGFNLYQNEEYAKGGEIFHILVVAKQLEFKYWVGLAASLQMQKRYKDSLTSWSVCCFIDEHNPLPHFHAAECLFLLHDVDGGVRALTAAEHFDNEKIFQGKIFALKKKWKINE